MSASRQGNVLRRRGFLALAALTLLLALVFAPAGASGQAPTSLEGYWQRLRELQALVRSQEGAPINVVHARLAQEAAALEAITEVVLPDGTSLPIDNTFLAQLLRAETPNLPQIDTHLTVLLLAAEQWPEAPPPAGYRAELESILARPEFQWNPERHSQLSDWLARLFLRAQEWLSRLLAEAGAPSLPKVLRALLAGAALLVLLIIVLSAFRAIRGGFAPEEAIPEVAGSGDGRLTSESAARRAQAFAEQREYRAAMRYLYLSSLLFLEEQGLLRYDRTLTNREVLQRASGLPGLAPILRPVVEVFDQVWYGYRPMDEVSYRDYAARAEALRRLS